MFKCLISILFVLATYSTYAMENPAQRHMVEWEKGIGDPRAYFQSLPGALAFLPKKLTPLPDAKALSDELIAKLNPEWCYLKNYDQKTKNNILFQVLYCPQYGDYFTQWEIMRSMIALAVWLGADPSKSGDRIDPAIIWSCNEQDLYLTQYLLEKGANPNVSVDDGMRKHTPLSLATNGKLVGLLLDHGVRVDIPEHADLIERYCSEMRYWSSIVKCLIDRKLLDPRTPNLKSPCALLHNLARDSWPNQFEKLHMLLDAGFNKAEQRADGTTPLHQAKRIGALMLLTSVSNPERASFYEFLCVLKKNFCQVYQSKDLRVFFYKTVCVQRVRDLLLIKDKNGKIPQEVWTEDYNSLITKYRARLYRLLGPRANECTKKSFKSRNPTLLFGLLDPYSCTYEKLEKAKQELVALKKKKAENGKSFCRFRELHTADIRGGC